MTLTSDTSLGLYQILSLLGAGGMGEVYLVEDTQFDCKVAPKLLPAKFTQDSDRVRRFAPEAKAASALNHSNMITIYEIGQPGGHHSLRRQRINDYETTKSIRVWSHYAARRVVD